MQNTNEIISIAINNIQFSYKLFVEKILITEKGIYIISPNIDLKKKCKIARLLNVNPDICFVFQTEALVSYVFVTVLPPDDIKIIADKVYLYSKDSKIINIDNKNYIKHNKNWVQSADLNSNILFYVNCFLGPFGIHKFYERKIFRGLIYLLTCGLWGVGSFFDAVELFFGVKKYKKDIYYGPLSKKPLKAFLIVLSLFLHIIVLKCYLSILNTFINSDIVTELMMELAHFISKFS